MRRRPIPNRRSGIIAGILLLLIFAAFLAVLRLQSFATEALAVYDDAHPTCIEMYVSAMDYFVNSRPDTIFIQDTAWQSLAHPAALRKKSATIYEVDCIKILELHLDRELLNITVKNNPLNIESSFAISIHDRRLPHVLDSLRRIGLQPNVRRFIYSISVSDETVYQHMITMMDEIALTRKNIPFESDEIDFRIDGQDLLKKFLSNIVFVKSHNPENFEKKYRRGIGFCVMQIPPPRPSIPMIFLDYLNPFGENYLHTKQWWL